MLPTMSATQVRRPIMTIAGPGSLGNALAISLHAAGYRISEILSRAGKGSRRRARVLARKVGACAAVIGKEPCNADVLWLCVPDREIRNCAEFLARSGGWSKRAVLHSSGALTSDELAALRSRGASVASVHPLMTFVPGEIPSLAGVPFAIEGDWTATRVARRIARHLGGEPFQISKADKTAYHAWGAFTSPLLTALLVTAEQVAAAARIPRRRARKRPLTRSRLRIPRRVPTRPPAATPTARRRTRPSRACSSRWAWIPNRTASEPECRRSGTWTCSVRPRSSSAITSSPSGITRR